MNLVRVQIAISSTLLLAGCFKEQRITIAGGPSTLRSPTSLLADDIADGVARQKDDEGDETNTPVDQADYEAARATSVRGSTAEVKFATGTGDIESGGITGNISLALMYGHTVFNADDYDLTKNSVMQHQPKFATHSGLSVDACLPSNWVVHYCIALWGTRSTSFYFKDERQTESSYMFANPVGGGHSGSLLDMWFPIRISDTHRAVIGGTRVGFDSDDSAHESGMLNYYGGYTYVFD